MDDEFEDVIKAIEELDTTDLIHEWHDESEMDHEELQRMSSEERRKFFTAMRKQDLIATRSRRFDKDHLFNEVRLLQSYELVAPKHHNWVLQKNGSWKDAT